MTVVWDGQTKFLPRPLNALNTYKVKHPAPSPELLAYLKIENAVAQSPTPRITRWLLTHRAGLWFRKVLECNSLHKWSYGLIGRNCKHWS